MIQDELLPTQQDIRFYRKNGYWLGPRILSDEFLERLRSAMDDVYAGKFETGTEPWLGYWKANGNSSAVRKTDNAHWANNTLRELVMNETIGAMAALLSGSRGIRLWHDQLLYKPGQGRKAQAGGNVGWHQDNNYWRCASGELLTAWVAFDDVTLNNGCMQVVPASHKWGLIEGDFFNQDLESMKSKLEDSTGHKFRTKPCTLKAGSVSFHHCLTIHGSGPNFTDKPRRSLVLHLMPDDAAYIADSPNDNHMNAILMRRLGRRNGDVFEGDFWPQMYPQNQMSGV